MKVLVLHTYTDCWNKIDSLRAVGYDVHTAQYDDRPHDRHGELVDAAQSIRPDFIVHIGAVEQYHGRPVPRPKTFRDLKSVAPIIHMCNDAGDPPWWPLLEEYNREDCFTVQVSIDGSTDNPIARFHNGMLALTPIDHRVFKPRGWTDRDIRFGMVGGIGHSGRAENANRLIQQGLLTFNAGPIGRTYAEMAEIMCRTKVTFNYGITGSAQRQHVKGRVVEAGFAGSALFELAGGPTSYWLKPGIEYIEYRDAEEVAFLIQNFAEGALEASAELLHRKIVAEHHPKLFWDRVLAKAGVLAPC